MAENEECIVLSYGLYALLRQAGSDLEKELETELPVAARRLLVVALINLVNGIEDADGDVYQDLYDNSVLSLWFPRMDLSDMELKKAKMYVTSPERKNAVLDYMSTAMSLAANVLSGDTGDPNIYDLRSYYNLVRRTVSPSTPYETGDDLIAFISRAYRHRLMDDMQYIINEEGYNEDRYITQYVDDEDEAAEKEDEMEYMDVHDLMDQAKDVSLLITPTSATLSRIPDQLQLFLEGEDCFLDLSPAAAMASF